MKQERLIPFNGYHTYTETYGQLDTETTPLLVLHGGPGVPHDHMENLSELAERGQPVVFYDQLGCGKSDRPDNPSLWTLELFLEEIDVVRNALGLMRVNILGQSWGGTLAIEYALKKPKGLEKLILSGPLIDTHLWIEETDKLKDQLSPSTARIMRKHEADGTEDSEEYKAAYQEFWDKFVCRVKPNPEGMERADKGMNTQVYETLWGPSETNATGILKDWSAIDRLHLVDVPTLLLSGEYDQATPRQMEIAHKLIRGSQWVKFENGSHQSNWEVPEKYFAAIIDFLHAPQP